MHIIRMVTVTNYAKLVNKPAKTVRQMCQEGRINGAVKVGGSWKIDLDKAKGTEFKGVGRPREK